MQWCVRQARKVCVGAHSCGVCHQRIRRGGGGGRRVKSVTKTTKRQHPTHEIFMLPIVKCFTLRSTACVSSITNVAPVISMESTILS